MGINGLLQLLKSVTRDKKLSDFQNTRVAVDTYVWLHKGIFKCAYELASGKDSDEYIGFTLKKVELLLHNKITPVMVFDGGKLPSKLKTEQNRERNRKDAYEKALEFQKQGLHEKARAKFAESVDVTPYMAYKLIKVLKYKYNLECIVAPYEADAQLAYLSKIDYVDFIITEDADLLPYGAKRVLFKLDADGAGKEIAYSDIYKCSDSGINQFDENMFLSACILSGCDYLSSMSKIGSKTAFKLIKEHRNIQNILKYLRFEGKITIPPGYLEDFERAVLTFKFQRVFCPIKQKLVTVSGFEFELIKARSDDLDFLESVTRQLSIDSHVLNRGLGEENLDFLGGLLERDLSQKIANGEVDPLSHESFQEKELRELKQSLQGKAAFRSEAQSKQHTWGTTSLQKENNLNNENKMKEESGVLPSRKAAPARNFLPPAELYRQKESRFKIIPRDDKPIEKQKSIFSYFQDPKRPEKNLSSQATEALHSQGFSLDPSPQFGLKRRSVSLNKGLISNEIDNTDVMFRNSVSVRKPFKMPSAKSLEDDLLKMKTINEHEEEKNTFQEAGLISLNSFSYIKRDPGGRTLGGQNTFNSIKSSENKNEFVVGRPKRPPSLGKMQIERQVDDKMEDEEEETEKLIRKVVHRPGNDEISERSERGQSPLRSYHKKSQAFSYKESQVNAEQGWGGGLSGEEKNNGNLQEEGGDFIRKKLKNDDGKAVIQTLSLAKYNSIFGSGACSSKFLSNFKLNQLNVHARKREPFERSERSPEGILLKSEGEHFLAKCEHLFKARDWSNLD